MPYGVTMAAALGARVIKIEDGNGDPHRILVRRRGGEQQDDRRQGEHLDRPAHTAGARRSPRQICAQADVFVTGFRSGVADKLGLGYEELRALNPRLVYMHAAGYGTDGPYAHRALYAQAAQAVAGSFGRQVGYWADPAQNEGMSVDRVAGRSSLPGSTRSSTATPTPRSTSSPRSRSAIYHQRRTGQGQFVRTSMISGNAWCYSDDFCTYDGKPPIPLCDSEYYGTGAARSCLRDRRRLGVPRRAHAARVRRAAEHARPVRARHRRALRRAAASRQRRCARRRAAAPGSRRSRPPSGSRSCSRPTSAASRRS